ncbi:Fe-S biogenesis protein NfuA, partial [bacterium]|nr:Fe-S biogenesis protein NfuA [bacterium]
MTDQQTESNGSEINLSESAQAYLADLLEKQGEEVVGIRIFINDPGTPKAETCIAYGRAEDIGEEDIRREYQGFTAYFDAKSWPFLEDAKVDYAADRMGGQLTIKAPNSKAPKISEDSPLPEKVNYILYTEVNPSLSAHG